uniref:GLOBIN domain-containing protein n=1 Tax=Soboliphyme baturini TaxID=241478 RepID=A0A183IUY4_9BILA
LSNCKGHLLGILPRKNIFDAVRPATRLNLSSNERSLLCNTWVTSFDGLYDLGTDIYTEIFNSAPEIRALFPVLADSDGNIRNCPNFRNQALKFVQVIALCLTALNNAERLDEILTEVGARHAKYVAKGFKMAYWDVFENAMVKCIHQQMIRRGAFDDDTQAKAEVAWRTLSKYIIEKMKIGFICELHHFRRRNFKRSANEASISTILATSST